MFAYKLLLSTLDALYIDTSLVSWFHLYLLLRQTKNGIAYNLQLHLATFQANLDSNPGDARGNGYWVDLFFFFLAFSAPKLTLLSKFPIPEIGINLGFTSVNITKKILFLNSHISRTQ